MGSQDILLGPLVPCTPDTRLLAWNNGQVLPGFVRVSDIIQQLLIGNGYPISFEWVGDGSYPLAIPSSIFNDGILRPGIVFRQENDTLQFLYPDLGAIYHVSWHDTGGNWVSNYIDVRIDAGYPDQLRIYNNVAPRPYLNESGQHFKMVII